MLVGLALGPDKKSLARWMSIGIAALSALYCEGLRVRVEAFGVD